MRTLVPKDSTYIKLEGNCLGVIAYAISNKNPKGAKKPGTFYIKRMAKTRKFVSENIPPMHGKTNQEVTGDNNIQVNGNVAFNFSEEKNKDTNLLEKLVQTGYILLIVCSIWTSLPLQLISPVASMSAISIAFLIGIWSWEIRRTNNRAASFKKFKTCIIAMNIVSVTTGCTDPMLARVPDPAIRELVKGYKAGVAQGIGVFGFGLDDISIQTAAKNGGIEEVYFADQIRGYGLISYRKVSVFGE